MERVKKDWISWLITILIAFLIPIFTLSITNRSKEEYDFKNKVEILQSTKLDITSFNKHEFSNEEEFKKLKLDRENDKKNQEELLKIVITTSNDVKWLIKNQEKGKN